MVEVQSYIIHNHERVDRKAFFEPYLSQFANIEIWPAFMNKTFCKAQLLKEYPRPAVKWRKNADWKPTKLSTGEVGCNISHEYLWQYAVAKGLKEVLIFEDDCVIGDEFSLLFNELYDKLPKDYDIFYIGGHSGINYRGIGINGIGVPLNQFNAHCYLLRCENLPSMIIEAQKQVNLPVDNAMHFAWSGKFKCYGAMGEYQVQQHQSKSDIGYFNI